MEAQEKATAFAALHHGDELLCLPNAWDAGSARVFEAAGFPAVATTSAGVAFALGLPDGQRVALPDLLDVTRRICTAVGVPVSADIEAGYGETPDEVAEVVRRVIAAGAVGVNLEDAHAARPGLRSIDEQCRMVAACRAAADAEGVAVFVNARTDVFWGDHGSPDDRLGTAIRRLSAYVRAGADGAFAPGLTERPALDELAAAVAAPLNVLAAPALPPIPELRAAGVARLTIGSAAARSVLGLVQRIAAELRAGEDSTLLFDRALDYAEANRLFGG